MYDFLCVVMQNFKMIGEYAIVFKVEANAPAPIISYNDIQKPTILKKVKRLMSWFYFIQSQNNPIL